LIKSLPLPVTTRPFAFVDPTLIFPEDEVKSKVKSSKLLIKSKSIFPELVRNEESLVILISLPVCFPEVD